MRRASVKRLGAIPGVGTVVRGRKRVLADEIERRKARALGMLRAGAARAEVARACKLYSYQVRAVAEAHGIPSKVGRPCKRPKRDHTARDARIVALLRAGHTRADVAEACRATFQTVKRIAEAHGVPCQPRGMRQGTHTRKDDVTRMTHAELDALEADVAARRAAGLLPTILPDLSVRTQ